VLHRLTDLPAADRNGKSDPYCRFVLNGEEVHKSEVKKKTLNPKWGENFEVEVVRLILVILGATADYLCL
jgi:Ca2+-dependent lipid-binding protein